MAVQRWSNAFAATALLLAVTACNTIRVRSDSDAAADIGSCHSYSWYEPAAAATEVSDAFSNPINDKRLRSAVAKRLTARGLNAVGNGAGADCLVGYAIGTRNNVSNASRSHLGFGIGNGWGWGRGAYGSMYWDIDEPYVYREGRISVDLFKAASRDPIWHAEALVDVTRLTGADAEARIDAAVAAIFAKFPGSGR